MDKHIEQILFDSIQNTFDNLGINSKLTADKGNTYLMTPALEALQIIILLPLRKQKARSLYYTM